MRKSIPAASRSHHPNSGMLSNGIVQRMLINHFEHPFKVSGIKGNRTITWAFGPHRENVWSAIIRRCPDLAVEAMASAVETGGIDINDGYFTMQIPAWVQRLDFFTAPAEAFPRLLAMGGDPNESDAYGITPIEYAISRRKSKQAIALIEAGAFFEACGPDGWQRQAVADMPEVSAAMEVVHLRQVTALAFGENRVPVRL